VIILDISDFQRFVVEQNFDHRDEFLFVDFEEKVHDVVGHEDEAH
jgi:hypothetical protein